MAALFDVAKYILEKAGPMSAMKLQKLVYYSHVWHQVWDEEELFEEQFEAWANGPVVHKLYDKHRGLFKVDASLFAVDADSSQLTEDERDSIDAVLEFYGDKTAQWLSDLTHNEQPWMDARKGFAPGTPSSEIIPKDKIHEYYASL